VSSGRHDKRGRGHYTDVEAPEGGGPRRDGSVAAASLRLAIARSQEWGKEK
jgi:hypothetical protein